MKNLMLVCIWLCNAYSSIAQMQGPLSAGSFTTEILPGSNRNWTSAPGVVTSNNIYSDFGNLTGSPGTYTDYLVASNFGFSLPGGAIITGIFVEIERSDPNGNTSDYSIRIMKEGTIGSSERSQGMSYPPSDTYDAFGNPADLWDEVWTGANINDNKFGVAISAQRNGNGGSTEGKVDDVRITVYYSFSTLPVSLINFTAEKNDRSVVLKWKTSQEANMSYYQVERSADGSDFLQIGTVYCRNLSISSAYSLTDNQPVEDLGYYRLKMVDRSGLVKYSNIITCRFTGNGQVILYPNKLTNGTSLQITNSRNEKLTVYFTDISGKLIEMNSTTTGELQTRIAAKQKGIVYYRIVDEYSTPRGSGKLVVY